MSGDDPMKQRVHVLMPAPYEKPGGLHSYARSLAQGQRELGDSVVIVDLVSKTGSFRVADGIFDPQLPTTTHYHFALSALPMLYARRPAWRDSRAIFHFHGPWHDEGRVQGDSRVRQLLKRTVEKLTYRKFDSFITASNAFRRVLEADFGISPDRIKTVHPGVDTSRFSPEHDKYAARQRLNLAPAGPLLVAVRRLEPRMGLEFAISTLSHLPNVELAIAGQGSRQGSLQDHARAVGVADRVTFLGRVDEESLVDVYRAGDVSVVPTVGLEGFGMVVLESMAAGTPVVATNVGGLPEAMGPFNQFLVPPGDAPALAGAVSVALDQPGLATEAREYALTRSLQKMASDVNLVAGS